MEAAPTLQRHTTLFLYPFFSEGVSAELAGRISASPLWERREIPPGSSEALYFPPEVRPILFENVYTLSEPHAFSLSFADHPLTLNGCRLHFWDSGTGCLALDLSLAANRGEMSEVGFAELLDFNESFRYIGDLYEGHREKRAQLQVSHQGQEILLRGRTEEFLSCLLGANSLTPAFDQRLVVFSLARLEEAPPPEWIYKFFNVDSPSYDVPDEKHMKHFLKHNLYQRWQGTGTLYGFTHYSGGCLVVSREVSSAEFSQDWLLTQFRTIYLDLALVLLFQLTTLRQLDRRLTALDLTNSAGFAAILADFIRFVKDCWFLRVSDQDQGRELFRLWRAIWQEDYRLMEMVEGKIGTLKGWFQRRS